jgi:hypothetical protein
VWFLFATLSNALRSNRCDITHGQRSTFSQSSFCAHASNLSIVLFSPLFNRHILAPQLALANLSSLAATPTCAVTQCFPISAWC